MQEKNQNFPKDYQLENEEATLNLVKNIKALSDLGKNYEIANYTITPEEKPELNEKLCKKTIQYAKHHNITEDTDGNLTVVFTPETIKNDKEAAEIMELLFSDDSPLVPWKDIPPVQLTLSEGETMDNELTDEEYEEMYAEFLDDLKDMGTIALIGNYFECESPEDLHEGMNTIFHLLADAATLAEINTGKKDLTVEEIIGVLVEDYNQRLQDLQSDLQDLMETIDKLQAEDIAESLLDQGIDFDDDLDAPDNDDDLDDID